MGTNTKEMPNMGTKTIVYNILQCPVSIDYCFRPYDEEKFNKLDYVHVYEGEIEVDEQSADITILENLFYIFNQEHPEDYKARSMSTSDVVILRDGHMDRHSMRMWYCDSIGWKIVRGDI